MTSPSVDYATAQCPAREMSHQTSDHGDIVSHHATGVEQSECQRSLAGVEG